MRNVLVVNAGSSSLKFMLFDMTAEKMLAKGQVERIGIDNPLFTFTAGDYSEKQTLCVAPDHASAVKLVCDALIDPAKGGCLKSFADIDAVGHRMVHGGELYSESVLLTPEVLEAFEKLSPLAPLHNPACLQGVKGCQLVLADVPHVGIFDTAFHQTMPAESYLYALPKEIYEKYGVRKYGFHGTSHKFVTLRMAEVLNKPLEEMNIITCHLGNGSSITAVKGGKCFDTSMGMTPLAGVMMGTRSGDIDPAVVLYLLKNGFTADEIDALMNKKGGVLGISGTGSSDMRDLCAACDAGNATAQEALARLVHSYAMYIGGYTALLGRVDAIVLTGGIGENSKETRAALLPALAGLGITLNAAVNETVRGVEKIISGDDSSIPVYVIPTNEELMIARETYAVVTR
ncbi:MAG: acetate kinase [Kiritimatiellae bacterium]|nr:acetate kinase [Kiritimatiellia bacterium]